jgi:NADH-quinone oxidoreductase subunit M
MDFFKTNLLSIVAFWPLVGLFVLLFINKQKTAAIKWWANIVVFSGFFISLPAWFWFDFENADRMQFEVNLPWIQTLGANFHVGIDGISLLLVMLTTLVGPLAVLSSWEVIQMRVKEYYAFMLMLQAGMLGVFISLDFFCFTSSGKSCWSPCTSSSAFGAVHENFTRRSNSSCTPWWARF